MILLFSTHPAVFGRICSENTQIYINLYPACGRNIYGKYGMVLHMKTE